MDAMTIWFIAGAIVLAAFVMVGLVAVNRRSIRRGRPMGELPADPGADQPGGAGGGVRLVGRLAERPGATPPPAAAERTYPELVVEPEIERPEPPASRLARLRRRLAGSNSVLSRGLLMLISRDRIDEDTWEDFEDTLITSDLGLGPTTELVDVPADTATGRGGRRPRQGTRDSA